MEETWTKILNRFPQYNFLQSPLWAETNRQLGHKLIVRTFDDSALYLGIVKDAKRGRYLEIPAGPVVDWADKALLTRVFASIVDEAKRAKCVFVRFRPQLLNTPENQAAVSSLRRLIPSLDLRPAPMHLPLKTPSSLTSQRPKKTYSWLCVAKLVMKSAVLKNSDSKL